MFISSTTTKLCLTFKLWFCSCGDDSDLGKVAFKVGTDRTVGLSRVRGKSVL